MSDPPASSASLGFGADNDFSNSRISIGAIAGRDVINNYPAAERPVPAVSQPVNDFIGRDDERAELGSLLRAGGVAVIRGMGGLGKTQLALRLAADVREAFPDGQLLIELRGGSPERRTPEDALRAALWSLRGPAERLPDDLPSLVELYRATLGGRRMLVLVDDAPDSASARHFVPPAPCALLVTSRERITLDVQTRALDLSALSAQESRDLLLHLARRLEGDPHTDELLRRCANLPLALRIVGDTLCERSDLPSERYLARLNDETRRLDALRHEDRDVYAIIGFSDTLLAERDPALAERWRMLHVCPAPFERAVVAALWEEQDEDTLDDALGELLRRSLLRYDKADGRYSLHDLLRDVARQRCPEAAAEAAHKRHAHYFCQLANAADDLYLQGGDDVLRGLALFDANLAHIAAGQAWAAGHPEAEQLLIDYAVRSPDVLNLRFHPRTQIIWMEFALIAAQNRSDIPSAGAALGNLGILYAALGEMERAIGYYKQDLAIARELGNRGGEGNVLGNLGSAYYMLGQVEQALSMYQQQLEIAQELGDRRREGGALGNLGLAYYTLGDVSRAIDFQEQHLRLARAIGDRRGERIGLSNLGNSYYSLGQPRRAIESYEQALEIARELGDKRGEGMALGNLGMAYSVIGGMSQAIGFYEQRLEITQMLDDRAGQAQTFWNLGLALESQGNFARAAELMQRCVDYERELGHADVEKDAAEVERVRRKAKS
jgi:tetratricopeptide (TPR) repeat protein